MDTKSLGWIASLFVIGILPFIVAAENVGDEDEEMVCDFIVVGAGTASLALASRLAEIPWWKVCVFERGPIEPRMKGWSSNRYKFTSPYDPLFLTKPTLQTLVWTGRYWSNPNKDGRSIYIPRFRGRGGTSRVYGAIVRRASPAVLDIWPNGWKHNDVTPYYKKAEDHYCYYDSENATGLSKRECEKWHGKGGPMQVNAQLKPAFQKFPRAMQYLCEDKTMPWKGFANDYNGPEDGRISCSIFQQYKLRVNEKDDPTAESRKNRASKTARGSSFTGYYRDNKQQPYLAVSAPVTKILFDDDRKAVGVLYWHAKSGMVKTAKATREVIVGGGALDTPHLLQVSGVGPSKLLNKIGVQLVAENEHVGQHLWDHISVPYVLKLSASSDQLCCTTENDKVPKLNIDGTTYETSYLSSINGPFSWIIHYRSNITRTPSVMSDIQLYVMGNSKLFDETGQLCTSTPPEYDQDQDEDDDNGAPEPELLEGTIRIIDQWPEYRGSVEAATPSIFDKPGIEYGWSYTKDGVPSGEFKAVSKLFRDQIRLLREMYFGKDVKEELKNLVVGEVAPGLDVKTDAQLDAWMRGMLVSALHPTGTCKMPECADEYLQVRNVSGLRVCDASAFATQTDGNPAATLYAMGEKLADMLKFQHLKYVKIAVRIELPNSKSYYENSSIPHVNVVEDLLAGICLDVTMELEWIPTGKGASALIVKWSLVCSDDANEREVADLAAIITLDETQNDHCDAKSYPRFNRDEASLGNKGSTATHKESSFVFAVFCQGYTGVDPDDLWKQAGGWKGDRTVLGSESCFKLNCIERSCSILKYIDDSNREFIYTETNFDVPAKDYVSTKKVVARGSDSSAFFRTGSVISNPGAHWYDDIASYTLEEIYASSGHRAARNFPPLNAKAGWWTELSGGLLIYETNMPIYKQTDVAAFDIDGTIIKTKSGHTFPTDENDWLFHTDNVKPKLLENKNKHINNVFMSNQAGLAKSEEYKLSWMTKVENITAELGLPMFVLAATQYNNYRKPNIGMWEYYRCTLHQFKIINKSNSLYVGDAAGRAGDHGDGDKKFAQNVGIGFKSPEGYFGGEREEL